MSHDWAHTHIHSFISELLLSWLFHVNKSFYITQTLKILLPSVIENVEQILCGFPKLCVIRVIYQYNKLNVYILYSGEGNGNPLQCSCLQNLMDKEAWRTKIHGVAKSLTWLSDWHTHTHTHCREYLIYFYI